jgi:hypothetical protein
MNWAEMQEQWERFKPLLKTYWPRLGDEDLSAIAGDRAALAHLLGQRYSQMPEKVEQAIAQFENDVRRPGAVK